MCFYQACFKTHQLQSKPFAEFTSLVGEGRKGPKYLCDVPPTLLVFEWSFCSHSRDGVSSCSWKRLWDTSRFLQSKTVGPKLVLQLRFSTEDSTCLPQKSSGSSLRMCDVACCCKSDNSIWFCINIDVDYILGICGLVISCSLACKPKPPFFHVWLTETSLCSWWMQHFPSFTTVSVV